MGTELFDKYTLLHFSCGVIAYFWDISLLHWVVAHILFEIIENTPFGMRFINETLTWWPGGKPHADSFLNIIGDNIGAIIGWYCAKYFDKQEL